eukprot:3536366-Amphidinium_carterae.1
MPCPKYYVNASMADTLETNGHCIRLQWTGRTRLKLNWACATCHKTSRLVERPGDTFERVACVAPALA